MLLHETVAAIATPPGRGGITVIRLSGPAAYEVAERVFKPKNAARPLREMRGYTAAFGSFVFRGAVVDEGIALCFKAPASYTGEDVVELSCHGGEEVSREIVQACLEAGAQPAGPGEFTKRAVLNGRLSLTQAEAVMDLISANSRQGVAVAKAALSGALYTKIETLKTSLINLAGHLSAYVDYPEEGVDTLSEATFIKEAGEAADELDALIRQYGSGSILRRGVHTAIVGSPNVGKSTLFNLLAGFEHAIVTPVAGTTRDVVRQSISVGGVTLHVADTAGLHSTEDVVEREGIRRSEAELAQAALVIAVFDGSKPFDEADLHLATQCEGRPALALVNKSDLGVAADTAQLAPYFTEVAVVSAQHPETLQTIEKALLRILNLTDVDPNAALLANERQLSAVVAARDALRLAGQTLTDGYTLDAAGVYLDDALRALAALTGEDATEAVLEDVFSRFCVGK